MGCWLFVLALGGLIYGCFSLVTGRFYLTRASVVVGGMARLIGFFLLLPIPVSLLAGVVYVSLTATPGKPPDEKKLGSQLEYISLVILAACYTIALCLFVLGAVAPPRSRRGFVDPDEEERRRPAGRPVEVRCPSCQKRFRFPRRKAGLTVNCHWCNTAVVVPAEVVPVGEGVATALPAEDVPGPPASEAIRTRPAPGGAAATRPDHFSAREEH